MRFPAPLRLDTLRSAPLDTLGFAFAPLIAAVVLPGVSGLTCYGEGRGSPAVFLFVESHLASSSPTFSHCLDCHLVAACLRQAPNIKRFGVSDLQCSAVYAYDVCKRWPRWSL